MNMSIQSEREMTSLENHGAVCHALSSHGMRHLSDQPTSVVPQEHKEQRVHKNRRKKQEVMDEGVEVEATRKAGGNAKLTERIRRSSRGRRLKERVRLLVTLDGSASGALGILPVQTRHTSNSPKVCKAQRKLPAKPQRKSHLKTCTVTVTSDVLKEWRDIGQQRGLRTDADIAAFLVKHYQVREEQCCSTCQSPLQMLCERCPLPPQSPATPPSPPSPTLPVSSFITTPVILGEPLTQSLPLVKQEIMEETGELMMETPPDQVSEVPRKRGKSRNQQKSHVCSQCGASFARSGALTVHIRTHTGEKPYTCSDCGKGFTTAGQLKNHAHHHTGRRPYVCSLCPATYPLAHSLKQHMRVHTGEQPYACPRCQQRFTYKVELTAHMRKHTGDRPYLCSDCGKRFAMSGHLSKHRRIHSSHRPFECEKCKKRFPFRNRLTLHMRTHTGEKPFLCADCGSSFIRASTLTIHRRIHHTFEKPCICPFCQRAFADSANLSKHKKNVHGKHRPGSGPLPRDLGNTGGSGNFVENEGVCESVPAENI